MCNGWECTFMKFYLSIWVWLIWIKDLSYLIEVSINKSPYVNSSIEKTNSNFTVNSFFQQMSSKFYTELIYWKDEF